MASPDAHIAAVKRRLVHLSGIAGQTVDDERRILTAAEARLRTVEARLKAVRPTAITNSADGDEYQALALERGQLALVIARAEEALS